MRQLVMVFIQKVLCKMFEDYTKYLSVDNGHGVLIPKKDILLLERYHIDYFSCSSLKELLLLVEHCFDECEDEELELLLEDLNEIHYYQEVQK